MNNELVINNEKVSEDTLKEALKAFTIKVECRRPCSGCSHNNFRLFENYKDVKNELFGDYLLRIIATDLLFLPFFKVMCENCGLISLDKFKLDYLRNVFTIYESQSV